MRRFAPVTVLVFTLLPMSGCTCHRDVPEPPPKSTERPAGFGALLPTARRPPEREVAEREVTPRVRPTPAIPTPGEAALPEDFPTDIPVYEGSEVLAVQNLAGNARNVIFNTEAESPKIFSYYKESMRGGGWNVTQEFQTNEQSFLSFKKGKMITNMTVSKDPRTGKKIIAIMYYEEQDLPFPEF